MLPVPDNWVISPRGPRYNQCSIHMGHPSALSGHIRCTAVFRLKYAILHSLHPWSTSLQEYCFRSQNVVWVQRQAACPLTSRQDLQTSNISMVGLSKLPQALLCLALVTFLAKSVCAQPTKRDDSPSVCISNGKINGKYLSSFDQDAFLGIPFALPPTPEYGLRFRDPVCYNESFPTAGFDAVQYSKSCPQVSDEEECPDA